MTQTLDQMLAGAINGDIVNVAMVSNQDNGIASYAEGGLVFHPATGGVVLGGPRFHPARLESTATEPLEMFFSDRKIPPGTKQPFNANATEKLGMSISLGAGAHVMRLEVFGSKSFVTLNPMGDLLVGLGPSLGHSAAGVFVVTFLGILRRPH